MMEKEEKISKSEIDESSNNNEDQVNTEIDESEFVDLDWIFDRGWLRTKK